MRKVACPDVSFKTGKIISISLQVLPGFMNEDQSFLP